MEIAGVKWKGLVILKKHFGAIALEKSEIKTIALNYMKYPLPFLFALLILVIAQISGLFSRCIHMIFQRKDLI